MTRADRERLVADLRRTRILGRARILDETHGFRLQPIALNGTQARQIRAILARIARGYANVCVGNAALAPHFSDEAAIPR